MLLGCWTVGGNWSTWTNPYRHWENMQALHRRQKRKSNPEPHKSIISTSNTMFSLLFKPRTLLFTVDNHLWATWITLSWAPCLTQMHHCSWILFVGSFSWLSPALSSGLTHHASGRGERDWSFYAVTLFLRRLLTFHYISLQNHRVSPVKCVLLTEPYTWQSIACILTSSQSHVTCQLKENSPTLQQVYGSLSANRRSRTTQYWLV